MKMIHLCDTCEFQTPKGIENHDCEFVFQGVTEVEEEGRIVVKCDEYKNRKT